MENMNNNEVQNGQVNQFPQMQQVAPQQPFSQPVAAHQNTVQPVNCNSAMQVTSIMDLQSYSQGTVVRFPDFSEGQPFVARVRRPSLLVLAKSGKIPNTLLTAAGDLFNNGGSSAVNENTLGQMYDVCRIVCESCLIQPSLQDIESAGMELSDDQIMAIFNYTQVGVKALDSFRTE